MSTTPQSKWTPWFIVISGSLFFLYQFIQMNMINSLAPHLMQSFSIDATRLGKLSACYFFATLLFLLISGQILDRFSTRKVILTVLIITIMGTFSFALSPSYPIACLSRFIMGIGDAFCFVAALRIASRWFPSTHFALASGVVSMIGMLGGMAAQTPLALLIHHLGHWRYAIMIDSFLGVIFWIVIFIVLRDYPSSNTRQPLQDNKTIHQLGYWKTLRLAYGNINNWLCGLYNCFLTAPLFLMGGDGFGSLYLQQVKHLSPFEASYPPLMIFMGLAVGGPLMGWISDKIGRRKLPMQVGTLIAIGLILSIIYISNSLGIYILLFFLLGFISNAALISYSIVTESNPKILTASSVSIVSFTGLLGGATFPILFGSIMDKMGNFKIINNMHVYTISDYHTAMWIMPTTILIAFAISFFIPETYCKPLKNPHY